MSALDAVVDGSGYPSPQIERNAHRLRQIGIGYANLAALLLTLGIPYDSDEGRGWAPAITALLTGVAYRRSAELAAALGPFAEFEANREPMLRVSSNTRRRSIGSAASSRARCWRPGAASGRERSSSAAGTGSAMPRPR